MAETGAMTDTTTITCPVCAAEVTVHFEIGGGSLDENGEFFVHVRATRTTGCPHAEAWTRGPHDGGGEPVPADQAA